ncbi:selenium metabolism-associated LysR family transcriptional regulator [Natroniella sulfidigena]|uniref:selenium metabolism-associated LysR family transcriptional regulator n=1 Tax=Natroniella sulfidigena TaxID=723921 RepID=UPI00200A4A64|nr:selenium metabolism-associated LysR family transcriptional regulator [Natroniella sulfidigena]MCK8816120.1 selenium metabolism-associated LysR family transcriptional regulator [Natroniella sulfidigena]
MKLKTLKMLVKLMEKASFSAVADELGLTQPAVSMQIKSLEEFFDAELVIRQDGELRLTPAGKVVYRRAKDILASWEETKLEVARIKGEKFGQLSIGASTIPSEYLLPDLLAQFYDEFPEIETVMRVGDSKEMIDLLEQRKIDLIIVGSKPKIKGVKTRVIIDDRLILILPKEHRLAKRDKIIIDDLVEERMLIREEGSGTRKAMLTGLKEAGVDKNDLNVVANLGSTEAIISAVEAGLGVSFISELAAQKAISAKRVEQVEVRDMLINRKLYLAYYQARAEELLLKEFDNLIKRF